MRYGNIANIEYSDNARLIMDQNDLPKGEINKIVGEPNNVIARSPGSGTVVSEGNAGNKRVRVVISESEVSGGSEAEPLVISTMVLGNV